MREIYPDFTSFFIEDDTMCPFFKNGSFVGGILEKSVQDHHLNKPCIVNSIDGHRVFRILEESSESNKYNLLKLNEKAPQNSLFDKIVVSVALVSWIRIRS